MLKNFLKKIFEPEHSQREQEKIALKNVGKWLNDKGREIKADEESLHDSIEDRIESMLSELDEKLAVLKSVDYESRKVEPRIKVLVHGNLENYIRQVNLLKEKIDEIDEEVFSDYVAALKSILNEFFQKSLMNYQKTTILVGDETADVHKSVTEFAKFLKEKLESNKEIINASQTIISVEQKITQMNEIEQRDNEIEKTVAALDGKIEKRNEKLAKLAEAIEKVKSSKSYAEHIKRVEKIRQDEKALERAVHELRSSIDFKALGNEYHSNGKKMSIVRAHKDNFKEAFGKDQDAIRRLLVEAEMDDGISEKIERIKKLTARIGGATHTDGTEKLFAEQESLQTEIRELKNNIRTERKRQERLKAQREDVIDSLVKEFAEIDVVVTR